MSTAPTWKDPVNASREFTDMAILSAHLFCDGNQIRVKLSDQGSFWMGCKVEDHRGHVADVPEDCGLDLEISAYGKNGVEPRLLEDAFQWLADELRRGRRLAMDAAGET